MALSGAVRADVEHVVFLSAEAVRDIPLVPHFGVKLCVEGALAHSGLPHTILCPSDFFQNDDLLKDVILQAGVYPAPFGSIGVARVDVRDVADAAANVLLGSSLGDDCHRVILSGTKAYTGEEVAAVWSRALGRDIVYGGDDLERWEVDAARALPPWFAYDLTIMYRHLQAKGLPIRQEDLEPQEALIGHPPRTFEAFVEERVAAWTA